MSAKRIRVRMNQSERLFSFHAWLVTSVKVHRPQQETRKIQFSYRIQAAYSNKHHSVISCEISVAVRDKPVL